ncbi:MAG: hypothetical protein KJ042_01575 [Deltaproteobacteria bacterium]|nr:hypothetical protein [Deltaproteobacteria bacterium]
MGFAGGREHATASAVRIKIAIGGELRMSRRILAMRAAFVTGSRGTPETEAAQAKAPVPHAISRFQSGA